MKTFLITLCSIILSLSSSCGKPSNRQSSEIQSLKGDWSGLLDLGAMKLTISLEIQENEDLSGIFSCLEQRFTMPVDHIVRKGNSLIFEIKQLGATYEGSIDLKKHEIVGTFSQNNSTFPLVLKLGSKPVSESIHRPQEPKPPYPYREEEVCYENSAAGIHISGTLTLPNSEGPFPAVLLIAGSGKNDRNETIFGHKPFLVLADFLTKQGIAVLRVDKRGVGKTTGNFATATIEDFANDVLAGIEYLKSRSEVDMKHIGLIGHSEGGLVAPIVATHSPDVSFMILLAGPGVNGEEILYEQAALVLRSNGAADDVICLNRKLQQATFEIVKQEPNQEIAETKLRKLMSDYLNDVVYSALPRHDPEANIQFVNNPWFRHFLTFEPAHLLQQIKIPTLALNGALDLQVSPSQNLLPIAQALEAAGNTNYTIKELPYLNHLFQTCQTGAISEYAIIEETISPIVLEFLSEWIVKLIKN